MKNKLLNIWETDLKIFCHGHYEAAVSLDRQHYYLGIPIVALSAIAGTSVFATFSINPSKYYKILVGLVSLLVAVLGALQTFLRLSERAERHRESGSRYGSLLKELEQYKITEMNEELFKEWADGFRIRWDELSAEAPTIPKRIYDNHHSIKWAAHNKKLEQSS